MAVDHALLESVQRDRAPTLRLYRWQPACLSFGRNQPARGFYDAATAARLGIDIVRRPTGGLAVLHDRELTYSFVAPASLLGGPRSTYLAVNRALVAGLRRIGVPAEVSGGAERSSFGSVGPCFAEPAAGEVVVAGRKLVGSAQRCEQHTILQHGSILLDGTQAEIGSIAAVPFDMSGRATSISAVLGALPDFDEMASAIAEGFRDACGICLAPGELSAGVVARVAELEQLYASSDWTWRR